MNLSVGELAIILRARDEMSKVFDAVGKNARSMGSTLSKTLTDARPALLATQAALAGVMVASVFFASDLNESVSKANTTFGEHVRIVSDFAETSSRAYGISKAAANEYSGTLGVIMQASGLTREASAGMSVELVKLAADLASFNNIGIDEALEKLRAGLVGEAEPLRSVGVLLDAASVKAKALELGLGDVNGEVANAALVQARYAIILEQTTTAQGDFARTSDGMANQLRIFKAGIVDAQAALGEKFLPYALKAVQFVNALVSEFVELPGPVLAAVAAAIALTAGLVALGLIIPPLIAGVTALGAMVTFLAGPLGLLALVVSVSAAAIGYGYLKGKIDEVNEAMSRQVQTAEIVRTQTNEQIRLTVEALKVREAQLRAEIQSLEDSQSQWDIWLGGQKSVRPEIEALEHSLASAEEAVGIYGDALVLSDEQARAAADAAAIADGAVAGLGVKADQAAYKIRNLTSAMAATTLASSLVGQGFGSIEAAAFFSPEVRAALDQIKALRATEDSVDAMLKEIFPDDPGGTAGGGGSSLGAAATKIKKGADEIETEWDRVVGAIQDQHEAYASAVASINKRFLDEQVDAYLDGGEAALQTTIAEQAKLRAAWEETVADVRARFGSDVPIAFMGLFESIIKGAAAAKGEIDKILGNAIESNTAAALDEFGADAFAGGAFGFNVAGLSVGGKSLGIGGVAENAQQAYDMVVRSIASQGGALSEAQQIQIAQELMRQQEQRFGIVGGGAASGGTLNLTINVAGSVVSSEDLKEVARQGVVEGRAAGYTGL